MRDPDERAASLALRDGGPAPVRQRGRLVPQPRPAALRGSDRHGRRRAGRPTSADAAAGKDALLVCDTTEMADALNRRLHDDTIAADAPTVTAARGHRIAVGDLILTRRNDPTIDVCSRRHPTPRRRLGAQRQPLARRRHRHHDRTASPPNASTTAPAPCSTATTCASTSPGYAITVHSAQGVTADTTHAVLGENTSRALLYVAMTRGRARQHRLPLRTHHRTRIPARICRGTSCSDARGRGASGEVTARNRRPRRAASDRARRG